MPSIKKKKKKKKGTLFTISTMPHAIRKNEECAFLLSRARAQVAENGHIYARACVRGERERRCQKAHGHKNTGDTVHVLHAAPKPSSEIMKFRGLEPMRLDHRLLGMES